MREPAELRRSAPALGRAGLAAAVHELSWLAPEVASLLFLARTPTASTWTAVRNDPAAVLLLLRAGPDSAPQKLLEFLHEPAPLELALRHLEHPAFLDWSGSAASSVYRFATRTAELAARLAQSTGRADAEAARVCGLLAPLGWMAVCAIDPAAAEACLNDSAHATDAAATQRRWWGLDHATTARRLARRWRLPAWLAAGQLTLPADAARDLGADEDLFHLTRVAVGVALRGGPELGLVDAAGVADSAAVLGVEPAAFAAESSENLPHPRENPQAQPLLRDLLTAAVENRRLRSSPRQDRLEDEADALHRALAEEVRSQASRLQEEKLTALAEFAAGAGHEINNPLAVILGQAQYLLSHEAEWFVHDPEGGARNALQKIIGQTRRIHGLLRDLMLFARPAPPSPAWHDLPALLEEVVAGQADLARQRQVRLTAEVPPERRSVFVDAAQAKLALTCLVRNAVEAAPADGWARLTFLDRPAADALEVLVEDSGPGPDAAIRESLFDPFFSGRSAGRGRGLGLPTAWRLARQQGGDLRLEALRPGEPTRFVLTLPRVDRGEEPVPPSPLLESILAAPLPTSSETAANGWHTS